jgi:hypothetical protein
LKLSLRSEKYNFCSVFFITTKPNKTFKHFHHLKALKIYLFGIQHHFMRQNREEIFCWWWRKKLRQCFFISYVFLSFLSSKFLHSTLKDHSTNTNRTWVIRNAVFRFGGSDICSDNETQKLSNLQRFRSGGFMWFENMKK